MIFHTPSVPEMWHDVGLVKKKTEVPKEYVWSEEEKIRWQNVAPVKKNIQKDSLKSVGNVNGEAKQDMLAVKRISRYAGIAPVKFHQGS